MLSKGQYFPDQKRDEQIVLFIRGHWLSFLPWIIFISAMVIVPLVILFSFGSTVIINMTSNDRAYLIIGTSAYLLITLAVFLTSWISFYFNVCIVTPEHLVDIRQNGLFNRKVSEQSLLRVQDVSAHMTGLLQTFFRYGTVYVETAGEAPNFRIPNIPDPNRVANKILKLHEELVKESGYTDKDMAQGVGLENPPSKKEKKEILPAQSFFTKKVEAKKDINLNKPINIETDKKEENPTVQKQFVPKKPIERPASKVQEKINTVKTCDNNKTDNLPQVRETKTEKNNEDTSKDDKIEMKEGEIIKL